MIRVLHIVSHMQQGGLENLIMNCYRCLDRERVQFDFLVHRTFRADFDDEIEAMGGRIYRLPRLNPFSIRYRRALAEFFREHREYRIVHCHLDCMSAIPLAAAGKAGVPHRIAHAHNAGQTRDWKYPMKLYFKKQIPDAATHLFACSKAAGAWMFPGRDVQIINNGIETARFAYREDVRATVRRELGLQGLTLGHVGRFMDQKNHGFLLDVFAEVAKHRPDAGLVLVGTGPLEEAVHRKVQKLGLSDRVMFLGIREDVERIMQGMDVFVLPSRHEGLPLTVVEALTAGLSCFVSDRVTPDCAVTEGVTFLPLEAGAAAWAEKIVREDRSDRRSRAEAVAAAGFDIQTTARQLTDFYEGME